MLTIMADRIKGATKGSKSLKNIIMTITKTAKNNQYLMSLLEGIAKVFFP